MPVEDCGIHIFQLYEWSSFSLQSAHSSSQHAPTFFTAKWPPWPRAHLSQRYVLSQNRRTVSFPNINLFLRRLFFTTQTALSSTGLWTKVGTNRRLPTSETLKTPKKWLKMYSHLWTPPHSRTQPTLPGSPSREHTPSVWWISQSPCRHLGHLGLFRNKSAAFF